MYRYTPTYNYPKLSSITLEYLAVAGDASKYHARKQKQRCRPMARQEIVYFILYFKTFYLLPFLGICESRPQWPFHLTGWEIFFTAVITYRNLGFQRTEIEQMLHVDQRLPDVSIDGAEEIQR